MASKRYAPIPETWGRHATLYFETRDGETGQIITDVANVRDTRTGDVWHDGAHRVSTTGAKIPGFRAKTFVGETAWSDAERYAYDAQTRARYG